MKIVPRRIKNSDDDCIFIACISNGRCKRKTLVIYNKPFKNLAEKFGGQVRLSEILETKVQEMLTTPLSDADLRKARLKIFKPQNKKQEHSVDMNLPKKNR